MPFGNDSQLANIIEPGKFLRILLLLLKTFIIKTLILFKH